MVLRSTALQLAVLALFPIAPKSQAQEPVPPPSALPAQVSVGGRTSTVVDVPIAACGTSIPATFTGDRIGNCEGFSWWVSQHYALRTDYAEARARHLLTLLELAYPHYVELFGAEPEGIADKRMAVCYASSKESLDKALRSDGIVWNFGGGGICYENRYSVYCYPSGSLQYHQRYILLHECVHQIQMLLAGTVSVTPGWYYEGIADLLSSHVLSADERRLTLFVLDKATVHNCLDEGIAELAKTGLSPSAIHDKGIVARGLNVLWVAYLSIDPLRAARLTVWRDELHRLQLRGTNEEQSSGILQELYGPWEQIDRDFAAWVDTVANTFHYVSWGWEQEDHTLWSYGYAPNGQLSQTDLNLPPGRRPAPSALRLDYDLQSPPSPLVGGVASGVEEPSLGCVLDFSRTPGTGVAGLGLGVIEQSLLSVLVDAEKALRLDGTALDLQSVSVEFPAEFAAAMVASGHRAGLTLSIRSDRLDADLRVLPPDAAAPLLLHAELPIDTAARERLLSRPFAVLSRGGRHGVTPFADWGERTAFEPPTPSPANRWGNPGQGRLTALVEANWRLGDAAPGALAEAIARLAAAAEDPARQQTAVQAYDGELPALLAEIESCAAPEETRRRALEVLRAAVR